MNRARYGCCGMAAREWHARYGFRPVLLGAFVQRNRYRGTCYRAANWIYVGETRGRGKRDRYRQNSLPVGRLPFSPPQTFGGKI